MSIRYKVLLLLTSIPLLALTIYLLLALKIFEDDKVAYVFDASSNVSATLAAQMKTEFNSVLNASRPIFQDFLNKNQFTELSQAIFNNEPHLQVVLAFEMNQDHEYIKKALLEKQPGITETLLKEMAEQVIRYFFEIKTSSRLVKVPLKDDRVVIIEKVEDPTRNKSVVFMIVATLTEAAEMFKGSVQRHLYLIDGEGTILFGPESELGLKLSQVTPARFLKSDRKTVSQGAETVKGKEGEMLVSFSKAGFSDLVVVSTVPKNLALSAVSILIRKSLLLFGLLISATVIISLIASSQLTSALRSLFFATKKVTEGQFDIHVDVKSGDEVGILAENFNIMAAEVSRLLEQTAEKARMESELNTARTVQETLFPDNFASLEDLRIVGHYEPASECGGDWWHYSQIGDKVFLWIGDATGHGAPAALITSAAKSAATIIEKLKITPAKALELLNRSIYDVSKGRIMMTFFLASYDRQTSQLTYANASHESPFLIRKGEQKLKKKDLIPLNDVNNPRLGQDRDTKYKEVTLQLEDGDKIFFYTDGISDIRNSQGDALGEREFIKALIDANQGFPVIDIAVEKFVHRITEYRNNTTLIDDVTFFMIEKENKL